MPSMIKINRVEEVLAAAASSVRENPQFAYYSNMISTLSATNSTRCRHAEDPTIGQR